ncbi:MAG: hypothetical protein V1738_00695 [Patescibacteria group bacterium]
MDPITLTVIGTALLFFGGGVGYFTPRLLGAKLSSSSGSVEPMQLTGGSPYRTFEQAIVVAPIKETWFAKRQRLKSERRQGIEMFDKYVALFSVEFDFADQARICIANACNCDHLIRLVISDSRNRMEACSALTERRSYSASDQQKLVDAIVQPEKIDKEYFLRSREPVDAYACLISIFVNKKIADAATVLAVMESVMKWRRAANNMAERDVIDDATREYLSMASEICPEAFNWLNYP